MFRQEKESLLKEAMQTFKEALVLDFNQKTAKEHLENLEQQLKLMEQVSHLFWVRSASSSYLHVSQILSFSPDDNSAFNLNQTFLPGGGKTYNFNLGSEALIILVFLQIYQALVSWD